MDAYRRISQCNDYAALEKIRRDLTSAYGEPPQRTEIMFQLAEIRISATLLGVRSITRHDDDIIFKTSRPADLENAMRGAKGTLRMVGAVDAAGLTAVYYRPPKAFLEEPSLLTVLRRRLRGEGAAASAMSAAR
jgi:transcription-repair coupling factor (superfamily II helicase)